MTREDDEQGTRTEYEYTKRDEAEKTVKTFREDAQGMTARVYGQRDADRRGRELDVVTDDARRGRRRRGQAKRQEGEPLLEHLGALMGDRRAIVLERRFGVAKVLPRLRELARLLLAVGHVEEGAGSGVEPVALLEFRARGGDVAG